MSITQLERKETQALDRLARIEEQLLTLTATALSEEITTRFTQPDVITELSQQRYAIAYVNAMRFSWLYGHWHVQQLISQHVELAEGPQQITFKEAQAYLESQVPTTNQAYRELDANMRLRAFTVAGVSTEASVSRVQALYDDALTQGQSRADTMQQMNQFLEQAGVSPTNPYYLELHYRNNMMAAYSAGRWSQIENNDLVEFLIYLSVMDDGTTKLCRRLDRTVKPKDDPFWKTYWPPNHHKCRGTVSPLGPTQYEQLPEEVKRSSEQVTQERIEHDPVMSSEHQFTSSPTVAMSQLPGSLVKQAEEFDLVKSITAYSKTQSQTLLTERMQVLSESAVPASVIREANLSDEASVMAASLPQSDEVAFGLGELSSGDYQAQLWYFQEAEGGWLWGSAAAYDQGEITRIRWLTPEQRMQLLADAQLM
jgi:SPP1 gp7 family putative phage head morphogenesis protein